MLYVGMLIWPMISVGWVVSAFQRSAAAIERIDEIFDRPPETAVATEPPVALERVRGAIRVSNLTFHYGDAVHAALDDVSFSIDAGQTLALVGPVGAGKSSVLSLLTREYEPPSGTVELDGVDVTRIPLDTLRSAFAVVPQDAFLFSATLHKNLAYAVDGDLDAARAREVLRIAGLDDEIAGFPRGLETVVGERGLQLSGGQKQRTTVARALLREAPVLLLDDCLSAVDTQTEARILDALRDTLRRRTAVVVAHRLSTVRDADRIVVLDAGRVVEMGTHAELVAAGGWYAETYAEQRLEAELEGLA
jgi:ATP-binding cassette subfamily B protein